MKKILCLAMAFVSLNVLSAQVEIKPGIKAGLNLSSLTNLDNFGSDGSRLAGFHIGGTISFKFADFYTLKPEILYSQQGSKINTVFFDGFDPSFENSQTIDTKLNYLSLSVNNKFFIGDSGFHFQVAPIIDILLSHKEIYQPEGFDIALAGGIGFDFPNGITIEASYKQGLVDIFGQNNYYDDNNYETTDIDELILNTLFQFSIAYQFDLSK